MDFLRDLQEARMTRNSNNVKVLTYTDCCERLFLCLLILELLRQYPTYAVAAKNYAKKTTVYTSYRFFSSTATDLYNFIYFVTGDESAIAKLKDPEAAQDLRDKTSLPLMAVNRYLTQVSHMNQPNMLGEFFMKLERELRITNSQYKSYRRDILNYKKISKKQRQDLVSGMLITARAKLRSADIIDELEKLAADKNLETDRVSDNEPKVSVPDINMTGEDLAYYRYIVGSKNLHMAKLFVEHAKQGKATNGQMNSAYLPAIEMIDDIVTAGPGFIQLLRSLHKRAKNSKK